MNNVYIYDSSQIHVYETEDFGSIVDATTSTVDHGVKMFDYIVDEGVDFIVPVGQDYIVNEVTGSIDYEDVWITETTYPVSGNINLSGGEENSATVVFVATAEPIILRERAIVVRKQAWTGSGSLFEIGSGLERMVAPYIGGSGTLRLSGDATIASTATYTDESSITYGSDLDHGQILAAVGSSHDYGQVDGVVTEGETDNGSVVDLGGSNPFGLFSFTGYNSTLNRIKSYVGSGSFSIRSTGAEQFDEPVGSQTFIVGRNLATGEFIRRDVIGLRFHGGNPEAFARVGYQGSGVLFGLSGGQEAKVYDYTSDTVVTVNTPQDYGDVLSFAANTEDYGQVSQPGYGQTDNGSVVITQTTGSAQGTFNVYGAAHSARSRDYIGSGSLTAAKHIDSYGEGQSSQIAFIPHYRSRGGIHVTNHVVPDAFSRPYAGSGSLFHIGEKTERAVFVYNVDPIVTGGIAPVTVLANDTQYINTSSFDDVRVVAGGSGTTSTDGFNIGTHLAFGYVNPQDTNADGNSSYFDLNPIDATSLTSITFSAIKGNGSNGGETPDAGENLVLHYSVDGGSTFNPIGISSAIIVDRTDATFNTLKDVTLNIPSLARTTSTIFRVLQESSSGYQFDHYGITQFVLNDVSTIVSTPGQIYETVGTSDAGTVDQSAGTTEDYGTVSIPFTNGISDYGQLHPGFFKFGNLKITGGDRAHANPRAYRADGQLNTSGAATVQFNEPTTQVYTYGLLPNQASQGTFLKIGGGMSSIITVKGTYYTSGGLFGSGTVGEAALFDYNDSSIVTVTDPINYGLITTSATTTTDIGSVAQYAYGETDQGSVVITQTTQPFGKLFEWSGGDIAHANPVAYLGSTARIRISGGYSNLKFASQAGESTSLFKATGGDRDSIIKVFTGTGSFFHIGDRVEKKVFSYNTSSIAGTDQFSDNGLIIHTATNHSDYGQIIHDYDAALSHSLGYATGVIGDENPFGLYQFSGSAEEQFFPAFAWNKKSAPIKIFNDQQDPADFRFTPHWRSRHLLGVPKISNGPDGEFNTYARTRPFIGEGRLFGLGDKVESATFRYTTESVVVVQPPENYGLITNTPTQNLDYGSAGSVITPDGEFDNGQVVITETTQPLTGLYQFSGEGVTQFFRGPYVVKPTAIRIFNEQQDPADFRFSPHWRSRPYEQGKLTGSAETPRARDFVGEGRLFGLGDKVESATFRYTTESIVVVEPPENYGLITSTPTQNLDFGSVGSVITPDGEVDFGQVVVTETTQSATGLYNFTGVGTTQFFRGPYSGKGTISFYKGQSADTDFSKTAHWTATGLFNFIGDTHTARARDFVGSGSLFHIGDKIEKKVYDYSTESVVVIQPEEDYGSITTTASGTLDYGSVGSVITPDGQFDNGQVVITQTTQPFGLFRFRGGGHGAVKSVTAATNTFEISLSGTAIEKFTSGAGETTALFSFTGSLAESFGKGLYTGEGSLFHIGEKVERVVFHYNTSSVGDSWGDIEDRGDITTTPTTNIDNGSIGDETVPPTINYGFNFDVPGSEIPLGRLFEITGGDSGHRQTFAEFSSGSLFGASGAAEAAVWQTPEETFLFRTSGGAIEKHVENYVGSGLIKYPEDTPLAPNAAVRFRPHWRARHLEGTPLVHGIAEVAFKGAYVSEGVFSRMYTHDKGDEWLRYRPSPRYVNSIYGQIGGSAFVNGDGATRKINVYGYYGDDRDPGTSGSLFGFGGGAESRGITPPLEDTVIFRFGGTSPSKWNPAWTTRLSGSPRLSGTPELQLRFNIFTNPEGESANIRGNAVPVRTITHAGSGTLFTAGSSAEIVGFNPEVETRAFTFTGTPVVRIRVILFGGGAMFGFGSGAESTTIQVPESTTLFVPSGTAEPIIRTQAHQGSGTQFITGDATDSRTRSHVGSGSLFSAGGLSEAVAVSEAESTILFSATGGERNAFVRSAIAQGSATISGISAESYTRPYAGEGSLFSIGGASESATVAEESTGLFEFNGSAEPVIRTRAFAGSGSLFSIGGGEEVAAVAPESTGLFTVSGEAQAPFARTKVGSGSATISGVAEHSATRIYTGEGSLSTLGGAAEIVGFNPAEETVLYEFTGNSVNTRTRSFAGSGTATVLNESVVPVITLSFVGDGQLSTFGGAAESRTIDVENTTLFETRGGATESFSKGTYNADGKTTISGTAEPVKRTFGNQTFAYVSVSFSSSPQHCHFT